MKTVRLERYAKYQGLRTLALRLLFITTPCAVAGGLWYWLSPETFSMIQLPWSIVTGILVTILVIVELTKWPLHKYEVIASTDGADEVLLITKHVAEARIFLTEYVEKHSIAEADFGDVTQGRRG